MKEITFLIREAEEGGYDAEAANIGIFAEGDTIADLKDNIKDGIKCYYNGSPDTLAFAHLHFVKDEIMVL